MEPNLPPPDTTVIQTPHDYNKLFKKIAVVLIIVITVVGVIGLGYYLFIQQSSYKISDFPKQVTLNLQKNDLTGKAELTLSVPDSVAKGLPLPPNEILAKVGEENIYKSDLNLEMVYSGIDTNKNPLAVNDLLNKIIEDSIILQSAKDKVQLTPEIYNSPQKNYLKRTKIAYDLKTAKEKEITANTGGKTVDSVSIWYYNQAPGEYSLDKAKEIALQKITDLWNQVQSGKITAKQASEIIQSDSSLEKLDQMYQGNAGHTYLMTDSKYLLSSDEGFNAEVWNLPKGGVTKVYDRQLGDTEKFYTFAQVSNIAPTNNITSYQQWLDQQKKGVKIEKY